MAHDWHEWHRAYDQPGSPLWQRLETVRACIGEALTAAPTGPIQVLSMCAGQARDLLGVLADHARAGDVHGRLVELDPDLAADARDDAPARIDVLVADAGLSDAYEGAVPADVVLVCGVFGNISAEDTQHTIGSLPMLCAPDAKVIWTRHRRPPDFTPQIRSWFADQAFEELAFVTTPHTSFGVGMNRFAGTPLPFRPHVRFFDFVGYGVLSLDAVCVQCGFEYHMARSEITPWLRSDSAAFVARFDEVAEHARIRPAPDVWSPLEYACHVRDVLRVQRARVEQAQREEEPAFAPMGRDERAINDRYNDQDPAVVRVELLAAAEDLASYLDALDNAGWRRTGIYNYPEPQPRTVEWIGMHTVHEIRHHRGDIGTLA
jgi:hypothetical protein